MFLKSSPNHITLALIVHSTNEKLSLSWEAAIALWIRRQLQTFCPRFDSKAHYLRFKSYFLHFVLPIFVIELRKGRK